jgi:hypothetical protein
MIYFRNYHWLPVHGYSCFNAHIGTHCQKREDIFWMLSLRCIAGGPEWRRVKSWERPSLWLQISSFKPKLRDWRDLEHLNFWNLEDDDDPFDFRSPSGYLDVDFYPNAGSNERERTFVNESIWRVAGRDGGWFTVEFAGFIDGRDVLDQLNAREVKVTPDGREERAEPDAEFWKKNSELYLVEQIPFGTVTVRVPRNVRDPEAYALRRAETLIGVGCPEHIDVRDFLKTNQRHQQECPENIQQDIFVELQFNGFYED